MYDHKIIRSAIDQLDRISGKLGVIGEKEDYTEIVINILEHCIHYKCESCKYYVPNIKSNGKYGDCICDKRQKPQYKNKNRRMCYQKACRMYEERELETDQRV